uniref:Uncharacterized protein n=1 Tax=Candidatus Kentrum sp. FM TaxID=2126340 RepID=A0A450SDQ4_9GAMM|nr:MAG: hypothetical protein BECKFM1743C_GA0114222_100876 [Candidatus Kentron sp. FM]
MVCFIMVPASVDVKDFPVLPPPYVAITKVYSFVGQSGLLKHAKSCRVHSQNIASGVVLHFCNILINNDKNI